MRHASVAARQVNQQHQNGVAFPDLTSLDFYLQGTLKNVLYRRKPATQAAHLEEIETVCDVIAEDTFANVARTVVQPSQRCADAHGGHFEQLL